MSEEQEKVVEIAQPEESKKEEPKKVEVKEEKKGGHGLLKFGCFIFFVLALVAAGFGYFRYYYVVADGVKAGNLNYITRKGYVFKTYEGCLIMEGFKKSATQGTVQNNELNFSVEDERLFKIMELLTNQQLQLHYNEFNNSLPWRGYSEKVVDSIISINNIPFNEFMAKYQQNGNIVPQQMNNQTNTVGTTNNDQQVVTMEEAVRQLQQAQEQLNRAQEQLQRLQQQQNGGNNMNNNAPANGQRRYQSPSNSGNNYNTNNRTDDGNVFNK